MLSRLWGSTLVGLESIPVQVEIDISPGLPGFHVVGLPDAAVSEAVDRVRTALRNAGFLLPPRRITVNLAPGDLRKEGPRFDLAIALGLLVVGGVVDSAQLTDALVVGELALDGCLRPVRGVLAAALQARRQGLRRLILPRSCLGEAALVQGPELIPVDTLQEALEILAGGRQVSFTLPQAPLSLPLAPLSLRAERPPSATDLQTLVDQPLARRALELAAAGNHHLLMVGPPGCGKTHLARCLPTILPPLEEEHALEVRLVRSVSGPITSADCLVHPPFQAPDVGVTPAGLFGGPIPGEVTRAHRGVLFLDELLEFRRDCIEGLRSIMDTGRVEIVRAQRRLVYPASFLLVAAMNPCPCGFHGDPEILCHCLPSTQRNYINRLSGPLRDRIDLQVTLSRPDGARFLGLENRQEETSAEVRARVIEARDRQLARGCLNSRLEGTALEQACELNAVTLKMLARAAARFHLSGRSIQRCLRLARTIADLAGQGGVRKEHVSEALALRAVETFQKVA